MALRPFKRVRLNTKVGAPLQVFDTDAPSDEAELAALEEAWKYAEGTKGIRLGGLRTQQGQDAVLREYRHVATRLMFQRGAAVTVDEGIPDDINDGIIFPQNDEALIALACSYLKIATGRIQSRRPGGDKPVVGSVIERRQKLLFWIQRRRTLGSELPFDSKRYMSRTREVIESLSRDGAFNTEPFIRKTLGREDLLCLIEQDLIHVVTNYTKMETRLRELAHTSQLHLAWCFGLLSGIRPCSLVETTSSRPGQHLKWRDVEIIRCFKDGIPTGRLYARITFRWLKGNRDLASRRAEVLRLRFLSPGNEENLQFSIPHRLLVLLLQRGFLAHHTSVTSVLRGTELFITVRPEVLDYPVLIRTSRRTINQTRCRAQPLPSKIFYTDLKRTLKRTGFPPDLSFYSFRNMLGTTVARAKGVHEAQKVLQHKVGSSTFHKHYDLGTDHIDFNELVLGEDPTAADPRDFPAYLTRVDPTALEAATKAALADHPDLQNMTHNDDRRPKLAAFENIFEREFWQDHLESLTGASIEQRRQEGRTRLRQIMQGVVQDSLGNNLDTVSSNETNSEGDPESSESLEALVSDNDPSPKVSESLSDTLSQNFIQQWMEFLTGAPTGVVREQDRPSTFTYHQPAILAAPDVASSLVGSWSDVDNYLLQCNAVLKGSRTDIDNFVRQLSMMSSE